MCSLGVAEPSATVRNRSQPSATIRNRPRDCYMAVPVVSSAEGVVLGGFKRRVASFRVAGVALRDIQECFVTHRKSSCVAGAILLRSFTPFSEDALQCLWQAQHFGRAHCILIVILRGRRSTLDVSCCVFLRIALAELRQVATRCRFRGRRGIL